MNLADLDLNLFRTFDAIFEAGNLTRAGERVGLSQPAMSNALARLRRAFDDELFVRTPQGMAPTPVAREMIGPVRQALRLMRDSLQQRASFDPGASHTAFRISMGDLTEARLLPPLLERLVGLAPQVSVQSYQVPRRDLVRELAAGSVDLAIDVPLLSDPNVHHAPLWHDRYVCVVRAGHPALDAPFDLDAFVALRHILISSRPRGAGHVDMALEALGRRRDIALRAQHYLMAPAIVAATDLALTVPSGFAAAIGREHAVRIVDLPFEVPGLSSHLYWHASQDADPGNAWLREQVAAVTER